MVSKKTKAPPAGGGGALEVINGFAALDPRDIANSLADVQTIFVARRSRLRPDLARVVAALAFGGAA